MFRYYISLSHQAPMGLGIDSVDITTQQRITSVNELAPITGQIARQGFTNVKILAFSLYGSPQPRRTHR